MPLTKRREKTWRAAFMMMMILVDCDRVEKALNLGYSKGRRLSI
jgi:hypothetical protein